jgi:phage repressor protein C with HTH and peptisase S24 domain
LWAALDALAERHGLTPSGLARRAGLNATTFNRSKRVGADGRLRWPSMESIAKTLDATGATLEDFVALLAAADRLPPVRAVPIIGSVRAVQPGFFDSGGRPVGPGWDLVDFPAAPSETLFALEVVGEEFRPHYRDGDVIVVSPEAEVRRGDRVVVRYRNGRLAVRTLRRGTVTALEFDDPGGDEPSTIPRRDVQWFGRIVWASQ